MHNSIRKTETGLSLSSYFVQQNIAFHLLTYYINVSGRFTNVVSPLIFIRNKRSICIKRELFSRKIRSGHKHGCYFFKGRSDVTWLLTKVTEFRLIFLSRCFIHDNRCNNVPFFVCCGFLHCRLVIQPTERKKKSFALKDFFPCGVGSEINRPHATDSHQRFRPVNETTGSFCIVSTHPPHLHATLNVRSFACQSNCNNS